MILRIQIAVATYRRPDDITTCLSTTLPQARAVSDDPSSDAHVSVLVIDNDPGGSAASAVRAFADESVSYVVEPTPGISAARNRALSESDGYDVLIYIDDDEEPLEGWLANLLQSHADSGAAAVAGKVLSDLDDLHDPWIIEGGFFERKQRHTGQVLEAAATNNLLLDLAFVDRHGLRFDDRYGLSGGGDTHFTRRLVAAGGRIVWCEEAVVIDHVPPSRMTREWVRKRARRMGNSDVVVDVDIARDGTERLVRRVRGLVRGGLRVGTGGLLFGLGLVTASTRRKARATRLVERGRGMVGGALGSQQWEYSRSTKSG
jgi:GT2 family glycosyltransferase